MIKIIKKRRKKNPNLKGEEFIDDKFIDLLYEAVVYNQPFSLQEALTYKNIGFEKCDDCSIDGEDRYYGVCECEDHLYPYELDYIGGSNGTSIKLIKAVEDQYKYLSLPQLVKLRSKLINTEIRDRIHISLYDKKEMIDHINHILSKRK